MPPPAPPEPDCHVPVQSHSFLVSAHGGEEPFLINSGSQRNNGDHRGVLVCLVIADYQGRTYAILFPAFCIFSKIHVVGITTPAHSRPPLFQQIAFHVAVTQFIHPIQFSNRLFPVLRQSLSGNMVLLHDCFPGLPPDNEIVNHTRKTPR